MAAQTPHLNLEDLAERVKSLEERVSILTAPKHRLAKWLPTVFSGLTVLSVISFAFWLGSLNATVKQDTERLGKLYAITVESKDSLTAQLSAINAKLDSIDKKLAEQGAAK
jgi:flagellar biosynthesis chaperone FliJ